MLNKELSHFSESSRSGNQISEYICSTFLGKSSRPVSATFFCFLFFYSLNSSHCYCFACLFYFSAELPQHHVGIFLYKHKQKVEIR